MSEFMEHSYIPVVVAMLCITIIYVVALIMRYDGVYLIPVVTLIGVIAGVVVPSPLTKK